MTAPQKFTARRAVDGLSIWPEDEIEIRADGTVQVTRLLPPIAAVAIRNALAAGDVRPHDEDLAA
jgi:hypothetical protein